MMKFFKKTVLALALLVSSALCCLSQTNAYMAVNGSVNPTAITDDNAYASVFRMVASTLTTPIISDKVAMVGFTNPQDSAQFQNNMQAFQVQMDNSNSQLSLSQQYQSQLLLQLTSTGYTELQTFVRAQKVNMALWKWSNATCEGGIATYTNTWGLNYGTPSASWDFYGDGFSTSSCSCQVSGDSVILAYNGTNTNGVVHGATETVSKVVPNGATAEFAGVGTIYDTGFQFIYFNSCVGVITINWSTEQELAYTKYLNMGLRAGGGCVTSGGKLVCSYSVTPICSNTSSPDYKWLSGSAAEGAWVRDYYFPAWHSEALCSRVTWNNRANHSLWICQNLVVFTVGASTTLPSGACTYNP